MPEEKFDSKPSVRKAAADPRLAKPEQAGVTSIISMIASLVGTLALIIGLIWWGVVKTFGLGPMVFVILGGVMVLYSVVVNFRTILAAFSGRRAISGLNTVAFAILVFGILVMVNVMAIRHHTRYDATTSKQYSLSEQTVKVLKSLNQEVQMAAFLPANDPQQEMVRDRLGEYAAHSRKIKLDFYDPMVQVDKVREYNVQTEGTVVYVKCGDRKEEVMAPEEERLTSAILAVTTGQKPKVYFLTGHGEYDPSDYGQDTTNMIKRSLESQQYEVTTLTMLNQPQPRVPQDCAVLVIAGSQTPLKPAEMEAIKKYADQGGKLFIALGTGPQAPDFTEVLASRGVTPLKGQVMDPSADHNAGQPQFPAVIKPEPHDITTRLDPVVLPLARALKVDEGAEPPASYPGAPPPPPTKKAQELMKTSAEAWLDKADATGKANGTKDAGEETGPLTLAAAIDESKKQQQPQDQMMQQQTPEEGPGTRIVVVADAEFLTDRFIMTNQLQGNLALSLKSLAWLTKNEKLISIPPKEEQTPYLTMIGAQKAIATILALFIIPGLVVFAGGLVWWRRRR
ncbi:MAG: Gldg family protein [Armatimonadia bacterium]